ncbi:MAG: sulfatase, partial [Verrucomicrobiae bacterium]|nr:sulfatase [Verrucomicrobiae bacterium]
AMNRPLTIGAILFFAALTASTAKDSHPPRPNILFILADDLGWHDPGFQGHPFFQTPNLDRLAGEGMRFTQAYAPAPICSASRAGFLTGKTPARLGFEFVTKDKAAFQPMKTPLRAPRYTLDLPLEEITIAEVLAETGYETAFFGKWHVSRHHGGYLGWSPTHGPKNQGFQTAAEDFGSHPYSYWKDRKARTFLDRSEGDFPADTMTGHAIDFVKGGHRAPFFLMVSHFFVHTPVHTRLKWLHDRCLAAIPADHPRRADLAHYAAMVATLDYHVGQLLDALDESGLAGSTVVVLTSDNGGHPEYGGNAPLRGGKWNLYEGGIRVPLVVRWPGHVAAGSVGETPVTGCDLFPTFAGLAGATSPPADLDGADLGPLLRGDTAPMPERDLLWHFPYYHPETNFDEAPATIGIDDGLTSQTRPQSALRSGDWKLIHFHESERDELYNLA